MAVKNQQTKNLPLPAAAIAEKLRSAQFGVALDADFVSEAHPGEGVYRFLYVRKTTARRYGRNYTITLTDIGNGTSNIEVVTQSRKVTVLFDTQWRQEVARVFTITEQLL